jgi:hypothetical protein
MATTAGGRVRFVDGQLLSATDLTDEQEDQIARHRRHAIGPHTWGIVSGGELTVGEDGVVGIAPVFAYDGYGRELVQAEPRALAAAERFELLNTDVLDVWLVYRRDPVDAPLAEPGCEDEDRAGRWQEVPLVRFTAATGGPAVAQRPPGVPGGDLPFPPSRMPPDDPTREWPVFLGQIHRSPGQAPRPYAYRADGSGRPYVGARAARIEPPWSAPQGARVELDPSQGTALELSALDPTGARKTVLAVSDTGNVEHSGWARVDGELRVGGGRVTLDADTAPTGSDWRVYHAAVPGAAPDELRIEIGASPGRVVIGSWSATRNAFVPHLTIEDSGRVVVAGDLRVQGQVTATGATLLKAYLDGLAPKTPAQRKDALITDVKALDSALATEFGWP